MLPSKFLAIAILAATCACGLARDEEPAAKPETLQPAPEEARFYVLTQEQFDTVNRAIANMHAIIERQKLEIAHLREQTKPVGSCS